MFGRTVFVIVLGLLIAGKNVKMMAGTIVGKIHEDLQRALDVYKSVERGNKEDNPTVNIFGDIVPEVIANPGMLNKSITKTFFIRERLILHNVEFLYLIKGTSYSSSKTLGITEHKEEAIALAYITFLSFFELVNFRVAFLHYSIVYFPMAGHLMSMCDVYFRRLTNAFEQFKDSLQRSIRLVPTLYRMDRAFEHVVELILSLSTDLVMDLDYLIYYKQKPDRHIPALINWIKVPIYPMKFRSIFPSVSTVEEHVRTAINQGREFNSENVFKHIAEMVMNVLNWEELPKIQQWFTDYIIGYNSEELLTLYFRPAVLDKYLRSTQLPNFAGSDFSVQHLIRSALDLIYKLRSIDYAILHERLPQ